MTNKKDEEVIEIIQIDPRKKTNRTLVNYEDLLLEKNPKFIITDMKENMPISKIFPKRMIKNDK